jgi:hypothetical protein
MSKEDDMVLDRLEADYKVSNIIPSLICFLQCPKSFKQQPQTVSDVLDKYRSSHIPPNLSVLALEGGSGAGGGGGERRRKDSGRAAAAVARLREASPHRKEVVVVVVVVMLLVFFWGCDGFASFAEMGRTAL